MNLEKNVLFLKTDVANAEEVEANMASVKEIFGKVNAVVNCAGIATPGKVLSRGGPMVLDQFEQVIRVNLMGTFNMIRVAADVMQGMSQTKKASVVLL